MGFTEEQTRDFFQIVFILVKATLVTAVLLLLTWCIEHLALALFGADAKPFVQSVLLVSDIVAFAVFIVSSLRDIITVLGAGHGA